MTLTRRRRKKDRTHHEQPGLECPRRRQLQPLLHLCLDKRGLRREGQRARHPSLAALSSRPVKLGSAADNDQPRCDALRRAMGALPVPLWGHRGSGGGGISSVRVAKRPALARAETGIQPAVVAAVHRPAGGRPAQSASELNPNHGCVDVVGLVVAPGSSGQSHHAPASASSTETIARRPRPRGRSNQSNKASQRPKANRSKN